MAAAPDSSWRALLLTPNAMWRRLFARSVGSRCKAGGRAAYRRRRADRVAGRSAYGPSSQRRFRHRDPQFGGPVFSRRRGPAPRARWRIGACRRGRPNLRRRCARAFASARLPYIRAIAPRRRQHCPFAILLRHRAGAGRRSATRSASSNFWHCRSARRESQVCCCSRSAAAAHNELNRFRFDATISVDPRKESNSRSLLCDRLVASAFGILCARRARAALRSGCRGADHCPLRIEGIIDTRVATPRLFLSEAEEWRSRRRPTVADLRAHLASAPNWWNSRSGRSRQAGRAPRGLKLS